MSFLVHRASLAFIALALAPACSPNADDGSETNRYYRGTITNVATCGGRFKDVNVEIQVTNNVRISHEVKIKTYRIVEPQAIVASMEVLPGVGAVELKWTSTEITSRGIDSTKRIPHSKPGRYISVLATNTGNIFKGSERVYDIGVDMARGCILTGPAKQQMTYFEQAAKYRSTRGATVPAQQQLPVQQPQAPVQQPQAPVQQPQAPVQQPQAPSNPNDWVIL